MEWNGINNGMDGMKEMDEGMEKNIWNNWDPIPRKSQVTGL